ncbi:MAG: gamma-glutamylcyclotransferase [Desulfobacterales bacterium]|nr:gamma-glutamylcyclotransferase [Desulfobacterales bacterium]
MYHFGYGSNLSTAYTQEMLPSAKFVMKAFVPNYSVQFQFWSKVRNGGLSNIVPDMGKMVHGVLFEVPEEEMVALDTLEGAYVGQYYRKTLLTVGEDGVIYPADIYRVIDPQGPYPPSKGYVKIMLDGAREHGLAPEYIQMIEKLYSDGV